MALLTALSALACSANAVAACPAEALRGDSSAHLPDCRAYEQVSPVTKGGYDAVSRVPFIQHPAQSAPSGDAVSYMGNGPFSGAQASLLPDARRSSRGDRGWITEDVTPPTPNGTTFGGSPIGYDFSEDLSQLVVKVPWQSLTDDMPPGTEDLYNMFLRHPDGAYTLVNSAAPAVIPSRECEGCYQGEDLLAFAGASSDFSHILFESNGALEGTGAPLGPESLYENADGVLRLVGVLPDGTVAAEGASPGAGSGASFGVFYSSIASNAWSRVEHAISDDGSRIVFQATANGGQPDPAQSGMREIYDRIDGTTTVEISAPVPGASPKNPAPAPARFWAASTDGSLVYFTSAAELTTASNTGEANNSSDLYRYNVDTGQTSDLTVDTNPLDVATGAGVQGVLGTSRDGAYVYFVATGELIEGEGADGQPNLYVSHEDSQSHLNTLSFIATLAGGDSRDWTSRQSDLKSYVAPDGTHVAFMSLNSLTGFDNTDRITGQPDSEVYAYSAMTGSLVCASCSPAGIRPGSGAFLGASAEHLTNTPFHRARVLSDDGSRLFFSSSDNLATGANGPRVKIYEYQPDGSGECVVSIGCISLISSSTSPADDVFLDASASGSDVFFATLSQLTATDSDNLVDVYDARVDGGISLPVTSAACVSDCQSGAPSAPAFTELVSGGGSGMSGNITPATPRRLTVTRAQKLARALRACTKRPKKARTVCRTLARKRYGPKSTANRASARHTQHLRKREQRR
ncbi:MAG TPA: hypothetical protein VFY36_06365 [Solirubrobacteraceae bacterium]|nr:hypothetical protein [Solirubrobacteraceae bacterium]